MQLAGSSPGLPGALLSGLPVVWGGSEFHFLERTSVQCRYVTGFLSSPLVLSHTMAMPTSNEQVPL